MPSAWQQMPSLFASSFFFFFLPINYRNSNPSTMSKASLQWVLAHDKATPSPCAQLSELSPVAADDTITCRLNIGDTSKKLHLPGEALSQTQNHKTEGKVWSDPFLTLQLAHLAPPILTVLPGSVCVTHKLGDSFIMKLTTTFTS